MYQKKQQLNGTVLVVKLGGVQVQLLPHQTALDTIIQNLFAGDHVTLEDPVQRDLCTSQTDDLITHLPKRKKTVCEHLIYTYRYTV